MLGHDTKGGWYAAGPEPLRRDVKHRKLRHECHEPVTPQSRPSEVF